LKKELENIKQKINSRNSQAEYLLSNAREEVKKEIDRIGERLRNQGEVCVLRACLKIQPDLTIGIGLHI